MKILIVNTNDITGGAARAAYRLHRSLLAQDIDSEMLVIDKSSDDYTVRSLIQDLGIIRKLLRRIQIKFFNPIKNYPNKTKTLFSSSYLDYSNIADTINEINPDIVHLHWICDGMLKIEDIARIKAPIVWSLHDMWAFTGGCHYDEECGGYEKKCGNCKVLESNNENDLSRKVWNRKQKTFSKIDNMTIVGLSKWLDNCSKNSTLLKDKKHINLPNPIDTKIFKPFDKEKSRELWSLPKNKKLILFGAMDATSDPRKGFDELAKAMKNLKDKDIVFVVFGSSKPQNAPDLGFEIYYLGHLHDDISLITLYSAVDAMIVPSLQENLSNAIMESLACATPVIGFDVGGNSDMIDHKVNGYLAKALDTSDLANGIEWVLNAENYDELCKNAREKVLREFDSVVVAKRYIELYEDILNHKNQNMDRE